MPANLENSAVPQDWKRSVFVPIPKKAMPKYVQTTAQMHSSHMLEFYKIGFSSTSMENFQIFKLDLEKAGEPEIKLPTSIESSKKQKAKEKRKNISI